MSVSGNIVPRKEKFKQIKALVQSPEVMKEIKDALPDHLSKDRMARTFLTALTTTPALLDCEPASLLKAVVEASQLGLPTDGILGHGYILPYKGKAKFIPGYRGLMDLARRSGQVDWIQARVVYGGDEFEYEYGLEPFLKHKEATPEDGVERKAIAVYAAARLTSGEKVFEVMYREDIEKIRQRSPSGSKGPWVTDWEEMARKTLIRRLMKYLPLSTDVQAAVIADEYAEAGVLDRLIQGTGDEEEFIDAEGTVTLDTLVGDGESEEADPPDFDGKGRISDEEEQGFNKAIEALIERARASSTEKLTTEMYNKFLGSHGVENICEIRSRAARKDFYRTMREEVEAWESLA
jgi:recombination protein RecT